MMSREEKLEIENEMLDSIERTIRQALSRDQSKSWDDVEIRIREMLDMGEKGFER